MTKKILGIGLLVGGLGALFYVLNGSEVEQVDEVITAPATAPAALVEGDDLRSWSDEQWREHLTEGQYQVLRRKRTERAHSSPLNHEEREGVFACAGCGTPLFSSSTKYDSRTGWPSFWQVIEEGVIDYKTDRSWGMRRTEVVCARCEGHLGHVFSDGPRPTGQRYCINGLALIFAPKE